MAYMFGLGSLYGYNNFCFLAHNLNVSFNRESPFFFINVLYCSYCDCSGGKTLY